MNESYTPYDPTTSWDAIQAPHRSERTERPALGALEGRN